MKYKLVHCRRILGDTAYDYGANLFVFLIETYAFAEGSYLRSSLRTLVQ